MNRGGHLIGYRRFVLNQTKRYPHDYKYDLSLGLSEVVDNVPGDILCVFSYPNELGGF